MGNNRKYIKVEKDINEIQVENESNQVDLTLENKKTLSNIEKWR